MFGEYRTWDKQMPEFTELAKYIFYTETSRQFDPAAVDKKSGRIGEHRGTAYYLLYTPNADESKGLDIPWLKTVGTAEKCKKLVVYCEKVWLHREQLQLWEEETGRTLRPMQVPLNMK